MLNKVISIPKSLHELHGERTRLSTLALIYLTGLSAAGIVVAQLVGSGLTWWQTALAAVVFLDIAAGVTANLSTSTNQYYQGKPGMRVVFLAIHFFHPAALAWLFPVAWVYFTAAYGYMLLAGMTVNAVRDPELQQNLAALFVVVGIVLSLLFELPVIALYAFAPLYLLKLLLGFAVRRPAFVPDV